MNGKPSNLLIIITAGVLRVYGNSVKNIEVITDPGAKYDAEVSVVLLISLQRKMLWIYWYGSCER